jgi:hypothetical protein
MYLQQHHTRHHDNYTIANAIISHSDQSLSHQGMCAPQQIEVAKIYCSTMA